MEEMFDVVDEQDEVVKQLPRSQVHREKLQHRAVHVLVFNSDFKVFLQKRSMLKDEFPGLWDSSTSGHVDAGETYDIAAVREVKEEIGLEVGRNLEKLFKTNASLETGWEFVWVYAARSEGPFQLQADEIDEGRWFDQNQVNSWISKTPDDFASGFLVVWEKLSNSGFLSK